MPNYADLDLQSLIDLLVMHTADYTKMLTFSSYSVEEFSQCKQALAEIQYAIKVKSKQEGYTDYIIPGLPDYINNPPQNPVSNQEQQPLQ